MSDKRGKRPSQLSGTPRLTEPQAPPDYNKETLKFCLRHLQRNFDVECLTQEAQAAFAVALQKRAAMTWLEITMANRHGLGSELMRVDQLKPSMPRVFEDVGKVTVIRYFGSLPMAGVRINDVFHILWLEPAFGDLYDHN